jgi:nitroreductase/NAD-dependent dihydropyrimidine dehydrogenase PreA subunit
MPNKEITTIIDADKCTGCGLCVKVCPAKTISMVQDKAEITGDFSIGCGHCEAVCPVGAIVVESLDHKTLDFSTFDFDGKWQAPGDFNISELARLIGSRRSCRNFKDKPVNRGVLEDLVKLGIMAPSGSNEQVWSFTLLPDKESVIALAQKVARFFEKINKQSENALLRKALKLVGKPELDNYYKNYHDLVDQSLKEYKEEGKDRLFYHAPAAIVVGSGPGESTPKEDALLATQNILLAAHAMGLGTCLIGLAIAAMTNDRSIQGFLGLPEQERPHSVIVIGYPDEKYKKIAARRRPVTRIFQGSAK